MAQETPATASSSTPPEASDDVACTEMIGGTIERRCLVRGPHKLHRWASPDGARRFDWG